MLTPRARMLAGTAALGAVVLVGAGPGALAHLSLAFAPLLALVALAWDGRYRGERLVLVLARRAGAAPAPAHRRRRAGAAPRPRPAAVPTSRLRGAPRAVRGPPLLAVV